MRAYTVTLFDLEIDTVFADDRSDQEEVRRSLIEHDGYDHRIQVELNPEFSDRKNG